ncbi:MAG TPA: nicotinate-nucleotide adenylyltransferase [Spirochaetota bacterium]|nr:nicotinate-nucleotide adenylyltransferase [Spirochaetota bacterium]
MKLGVLGGTFNPVHVGHLINADVVREDLGLDRMLFIPSRMPVHKEIDASVLPDDRYEMLRLATEGNDRFSVSRVEIDREEPSYSIITLRDLAHEFPGSDLYLVVGADSFNEIHTWRDYRDIVAIATFAVMMRPGIIPDNPAIDAVAARYIMIRNPLIDLSSTEIRARVRTGRSIRYMVHDGVGEYIKDKGLYRD